jgi:hypothetical protein
MQDFRHLATGTRTFDRLTRLAGSPDLPTVDAPGTPSEQPAAIAAGLLHATEWRAERVAATSARAALLGPGTNVAPDAPPPRQAV